MAATPPIAPEPGAENMTSEEEEKTESPEQEAEEEKSGTEVEIYCAARDCKWNKQGMCSKAEINVSAGPEVKCLSYERGNRPAPPAPKMGGGLPPMGGGMPAPMGMGGLPELG